MKKLIQLSVMSLFILTLIFNLNITYSNGNNHDALEEALSEVGITKKHLAIEAKEYWGVFPHYNTIPYVLPFFKDVFSEPLKLYDFGKVIGNTIQDYLNPIIMKKKNSSLHSIVYLLGVDKRFTGFRKYSVNLDPKTNEKEPLYHALKHLYSMCGDRLEAFTYGGDGLKRKAELDDKLKKFDKDLEKIVAELILNIADAYHWNKLSRRNIKPSNLQKVFKIRRLGETQTDGAIYYPEMDDVASTLDERSLYYSSMKVMQAGETARKQISDLLQGIKKKPDNKTIRFDSKKEKSETKKDWSKIDFTFPTPIGTIYIKGSNNDKHEYVDSLLVIDLGGDDTYIGPVAASSSVNNPISILIDMDGDDTYKNTGQYANYPSQGAGILGTGLLIDVNGDDNYEATRFAQGAGMFGIGVLLDENGDDKYKLEITGQGAGFFGIGMNLDVLGDDYYYICGDGQGCGGVGGGIGILANYSGNDSYNAEPYAKIYNRSDYHSKFLINGNNVQGAGMGRRADLTDGHSWAGGLGAIVDIKGDDTYYSGNWSLGIGYWYGTGIVYEGSGNDTYKSCYFTQASGAHFCMGAMIDEQGDDKHILYETSGAALAFGWDFTVAMLVDKGGNDYYEAKIISMGLADICSVAMFFNIGGDDHYKLGKGTLGMGASDFQDRYKTPSRIAPYFYYARNIGVMIDLFGNDKYTEWDVSKDEENETEKWGNNKIWLNPTKDSEKYGFTNYGIGYDTENGYINEVTTFDNTKPADIPKKEDKK